MMKARTFQQEPGDISSYNDLNGNSFQVERYGDVHLNAAKQAVSFF